MLKVRDFAEVAEAVRAPEMTAEAQAHRDVDQALGRLHSAVERGARRILQARHLDEYSDIYEKLDPRNPK